MEIVAAPGDDVFMDADWDVCPRERATYRRSLLRDAEGFVTAYETVRLDSRPGAPPREGMSRFVAEIEK